MFATIDRIDGNIVSLELDINKIVQIKNEEIPYPFKVGDIFKVIVYHIKDDDYEVIFLEKSPDEKQKRLEKLYYLREKIKNKKH